VTGESLVGLYEVAQMAGVTTQAVGNWRTRYPDFPEPVARLRMGPVFDARAIRRWLAKWQPR
jgi:chromosome partitioning protein